MSEIIYSEKKKVQLREGRYRKKQYIINMVPDRVIFFTPVKGMIPNTSNLAQNFFITNRDMKNKSGSPIIKFFNKPSCVIFLRFLVLLNKEC